MYGHPIAITVRTIPDDALILISTNPITIPFACVPEWERTFLREHPSVEFPCQGLSCLAKWTQNKTYSKNHLVSTVYHVLVEEISSELYVRIIVFMHLSPEHYMTSIEEFRYCNTLHRILFTSELSHLPLLSQVFPYRTAPLPLVEEPPRPLVLPVEYPFSNFFDREYRDEYLYLYSPCSKQETYRFLSPNKGLDQFLQSRETIPVGNWFCHAVGDHVISPYCSEIRQLNDEFRMCGGFIYGDALSGKTTEMIRFIRRQSEKELTLILVSANDRVWLSKLYTNEQSDLVFVWEKKDIKLLSNLHTKHRIVICNSRLMRNRYAYQKLKQLSIYRIVIDKCEECNIQPSKIASFMCSVIWIICSELNHYLVYTIYELLRLPKYMNVYPKSVPYSYSMLEAAFVMLIGFRMSREPKRINIFKIAVPRLTLAPRQLQAQHALAIQHSLQSTDKGHVEGLLRLLSNLDSGVAFDVKSLQASFMQYSGNLRPPLTFLDSYDQLAMETRTVEITHDAQCPICMEEMERPVRNSACQHATCFSCLLQWHEIRRCCPSCRAPFRGPFRALLMDIQDANGSRRTICRKRHREEDTVIHLQNRARLDSLISYIHQRLLDFPEENILIFTHFHDLVCQYANSLSHLTSNIMQFPHRITFHKFQSILECPQIGISHTCNMRFWKTDDRFAHVILMDDPCGKAMCTWNNYFQSCRTKTIYITTDSVEELLYEELCKRKKNSHYDVDLSNLTPKSLLREYARFDQENDFLSSER